MDTKDFQIMAQTAYKVAGWIHSAEINTGASFDEDYLHNMARTIATGMKKLAGSPSAGQAGGSTPQPSPRAEGSAMTGHPGSPSAPSCPRCDAPMDLNNNWTGLGDYEGHKASESIEWRCSQRGKYIKNQGWEGCDGARWRDLKVEGLPHKAKSA